MTPPLYAEIQSRLAEALNGTTSLREFHRWFAPATWNITDSSDPETAHLSFEIEHVFAQRSAGQLTAEEFRGELRDLARCDPHDITARNLNLHLVIQE